MGNGTKVALVALLILMVVVIARFVRDTSDEGDAELRAGVARPQDAAKAKATPSGTADASQGRTTVIAKQEKKAPVPANNTGNPTGASGPLVTSHMGAPSSVSGTTPRVNDPAPRGPGTALPPSGGAAPPGNPGGPLDPRGFTPLEAPRVGIPPVGDPRHAAPRGTEGAPPEVKSPLRPGLQVPAPGSDSSQKVVVDVRPQDRTDSTHLPATPKVPAAPVTGGDGTRPGPLPVPDEGNRFAGDGKGSGAGPIAGSGFPKTHVIEKGDSFWTIAERYYKKGILWPQIEKANPGVKVLPGKTLTIPAPVIPAKRVATSRNLPDSLPETEIASRPETGPGPARKTPPVVPRKNAPQGTETGMTAAREYRVQKGDTLSSLAKRFYKDAFKSHLIEEANTNLKYQVLREGSTIRIPAEK